MSEKLEKPQETSPESAQSETTYKTSDPRPHYVELDALRGIAILGVVLCHTPGGWYALTQSYYLSILGANLLDLLAFGYLGVPLFFLLSGYLLTWTEEGRRRRGSYSILNYTKRRALRLLPAYYLAIAVVILIHGYLCCGRPVLPPFEVMALHLTFLQGLAPSYPMGLDDIWWSLTPEVVFYALLPLLVLKLRKLSQRVVILAVLMAISLATRVLQAYDVFSLIPWLNGTLSGQDRMYYYPTTTLYLFLVGMLLRMMVERRAQTDNQPGRRQFFVASALTVVSVVVLLAFPFLVMKPEEILHQPTANLLEGIVILGFASALLSSPILKPVLAFRPLAFLGKISYSLFLLHTAVIGMVAYYAQDTVHALVANQSEPMVLVTFMASVLVMLATSGVVAYLSYRYIETPFLRYKPK